MMKRFKAHGKFIITGEYLVLKGAKSLAIPLTLREQVLEIGPAKDLNHHWCAIDEKGKIWFEALFDASLMVISSSALSKAEALRGLLQSIQIQRPDLFSQGLSYKSLTNFSHHWGMGSSSALVANLSQWANIDPYQLNRIFGEGSGVDVACALSQTPIIYRVQDNLPQVEVVDWRPHFIDNLFFVFLGQKKNSREAVRAFEKDKVLEEHVLAIDRLTASMLQTKVLSEFQALMIQHEQLVGLLIHETPIQIRLFSDFPGAIKSLGAWGGDFILVATSLSMKDVRQYFSSRGQEMVFRWKELMA